MKTITKRIHEMEAEREADAGPAVKRTADNALQTEEQQRVEAVRKSHDDHLRKSYGMLTADERRVAGYRQLAADEMRDPNAPIPTGNVTIPAPMVGPNAASILKYVGGVDVSAAEMTTFKALQAEYQAISDRMTEANPRLLRSRRKELLVQYANNPTEALAAALEKVTIDPVKAAAMYEATQMAMDGFVKRLAPHIKAIIDRVPEKLVEFAARVRAPEVEMAKILGIPYRASENVIAIEWLAWTALQQRKDTYTLHGAAQPRTLLSRVGITI